MQNAGVLRPWDGWFDKPVLSKVEGLTTDFRTPAYSRHRWCCNDSQNASGQPGLKPTTFNQYYTTPPLFCQETRSLLRMTFTLCSKYLLNILEQEELCACVRSRRIVKSVARRLDLAIQPEQGATFAPTF